MCGVGLETDGKGKKRAWGLEGNESKWVPYRNFEVNHLLGKSAHIIIEAEPVFARLLRRKHKISLAFLLGVHNDLVPGAHNAVVDIEGTARLDLDSPNQIH